MLSFEITKMWIAVLKINLLFYLLVIFGTLSFPTEPVGRVPSNCADRGDQVYLVPSNLCIRGPMYKISYDNLTIILR